MVVVAHKLLALKSAAGPKEPRLADAVVLAAADPATGTDVLLIKRRHIAALVRRAFVLCRATTAVTFAVGRMRWIRPVARIVAGMAFILMWWWMTATTRSSAVAHARLLTKSLSPAFLASALRGPLACASRDRGMAEARRVGWALWAFAPADCSVRASQRASLCARVTRNRRVSEARRVGLCLWALATRNGFRSFSARRALRRWRECARAVARFRRWSAIMATLDVSMRTRRAVRLRRAWSAPVWSFSIARAFWAIRENGPPAFWPKPSRGARALIAASANTVTTAYMILPFADAKADALALRGAAAPLTLPPVIAHAVIVAHASSVTRARKRVRVIVTVASTGSVIHVLEDGECGRPRLGDAVSDIIRLVADKDSHSSCEIAKLAVVHADQPVCRHRIPSHRVVKDKHTGCCVAYCHAIDENIIKYAPRGPRVRVCKHDSVCRYLVNVYVLNGELNLVGALCRQVDPVLPVNS